ncbi:MAG: hypothetical protein K0S88_6040, partial [Actinomycetia bacterium]|nr:hypothetical protein [Actinomycetes bacterium]
RSGAAVLIAVAVWLLRAGLRRRRVHRLEQKSATLASDPSPRPGSVDPDPAATPGRTSTLDLDRPPPPAAERQALTDEVDQLSPDDGPK